MLIALFPFPTKRVGDFISTGAENTAVAFYTGFSGLISSSMCLLTAVILGHKYLILDPDKNVPAYRAMLKGQLIGAGCYATMTVIALFASHVALVLSFAMWIYWAISVKDDKEVVE
ncbi:hypothetical protein BH09BAC4_BH09BAC4_39020 [soil metagenome]